MHFRNIFLLLVFVQLPLLAIFEHNNLHDRPLIPSPHHHLHAHPLVPVVPVAMPAPAAVPGVPFNLPGGLPGLTYHSLNDMSGTQRVLTGALGLALVCPVFTMKDTQARPLKIFLLSTLAITGVALWGKSMQGKKFTNYSQYVSPIFFASCGVSFLHKGDTSENYFWSVIGAVWVLYGFEQIKSAVHQGY